MNPLDALQDINSSGGILTGKSDRLLHIGEAVDLEVSYETNTIKPFPIHITEGERTGHFGCFGCKILRFGR